ncbi:hypothetical protein O5282_12645 [Escherichia coli]|nr:hypothetical protein [Escherichia coli]
MSRLVAHGQNITLAMKEGVPQRVLLKDFMAICDW